ncbi:hypothetical protein [Comamonas jiangduensis]|uniref:hypothetical protein n=1 Tax=Comamonas jiangduensis TaxID=1194168 RepID=UPI0028AD4D3D|nr:hypothetical protein [Comamonas jiangduensis]
MSNVRSMDAMYNDITRLIDESLAAVLQKVTKSTHEDLQEAITKSRQLLESFRDKTNQDIQELRELSEWDTFTIAFYGETNAGKSTLIETLRILLGDSEKLAAQQQFQALSKDLYVDVDSLLAMTQTVQTLQTQLAEAQRNSDAVQQQHTEVLAHHRQPIEKLQAKIADIRQHLSLWQKIVHLFKKLDEEKALVPQLHALDQLQAGQQAQQREQQAQVHQVQKQLDTAQSQLGQAERIFAPVQGLQDGQIIGNGRSDFTLKSQAYRFSVGNQKFQLIDVPGIEGDEKQVMSAIDATVKTAHAVFYVTRNATPPGSGSDGKEGTIDKIKRQLGKQTEVWAIFNKSVNNPQALQGKSLVSANDDVGLQAMDKTLIEYLGTHTYKGHHCLSGMPAFLAVASCFVPHSPHVKNREKYLACMSQEELLQRTQMDSFVQFLRNDLCNNYQQKIRFANEKKVRTCLDDGITQLQQASQEFAKAATKLKTQLQSATSQLDGLLGSTSQKLKSECHDELQQLQSSMRTDIYEFIEQDNSNDDFKGYLTDAIEELKTSVGASLEQRFAQVFNTFKAEAESIIQSNQKNVNEILQYSINDPFSSLQLSFTTDFKMDNGINVLALISSLGGAAALVWASFLASNPVGWTTAAVLGAVGLVFSFYKAVRSFFSSEYKKEQQRKSTDENLKNIFSKLTQMLDGNLESASEKIAEALEQTKTQMRLPYEQSITTEQALSDIAQRITSLRDQFQRNTAVPTTTNVTAPAVAV